MVLVLKTAHYEEIVAHSKDVYPIEACGLLVGLERLDKRIVSEVRRASNVLDSPSRYQVDPEVELEVLMDAEKRSLELVGIYHSHPYWPASPSGVDESLASFKDVSYAIYSVSEDSFASYTWDGNRFEPEEVEIE